jgi:alkylation response protein AidB-like acyl-CoA dehydrogenase
MDELSAEERAIVETVRDFVDERVKPVVRELEHENTYPEQLIESMKQLGIFGLAIPEPYGDVQVSTPCYAMVTEELARGWMSLAGAMGGHTVVAKLINAFGTPDQKECYLPRMATGELRATMALTEPSGGSDLAALRTKAEWQGNHYLINGSKIWTSYARLAEFCFLLARTSPEKRAISVFLLPMDRPGSRCARSRAWLATATFTKCSSTMSRSMIPNAWGQGAQSLANLLWPPPSRVA